MANVALIFFPKLTGKICQCWYDEIASLPTFLLHLEQFTLPLESSIRKLGANIKLAFFQRKEGW
jgi:hypothetical protein